MNASRPWIVATLLAGLLVACASSPSPAPVLLTLPPAVAAAAVAPSAPASAPLLAVRRIAIPEYLVARRVRYRADASTLAEWPNPDWAERIEIGISREFVAALHQQLPGWAMCETNCGDQVPALTLQVELVPLDYLRSAQKLQARARITLSGAGVAPTVLQVQELAYDIASSGDSAQAQSQAMAKLIEQVAAAAAPMIRATKP